MLGMKGWETIQGQQGCGWVILPKWFKKWIVGLTEGYLFSKLCLRGWELFCDFLIFIFNSGHRGGLWRFIEGVVLEAMLARMRAFWDFLLPYCNNGYWDGLWRFTEGCCSRSYACEDEGYLKNSWCPFGTVVTGINMKNDHVVIHVLLQKGVYVYYHSMAIEIGLWYQANSIFNQYAIRVLTKKMKAVKTGWSITNSLT